MSRNCRREDRALLDGDGEIHLVAQTAGGGSDGNGVGACRCSAASTDLRARTVGASGERAAHKKDDGGKTGRETRAAGDAYRVFHFVEAEKQAEEGDKPRDLVG